MRATDLSLERERDKDRETAQVSYFVPTVSIYTFSQNISIFLFLNRQVKDTSARRY
jgi:hypothetical protein